MRHIFAIIALAGALAGCSIFGPVEPVSVIAVPGSLPEAGKQAQNAINEANLLLTAAAHLVSDNVKERIWTKQEAQGYLDRIKDYARRVDQAQALLRAGNIADAGKQAEATRGLVVLLQREIAARARKERNP